MAAADGGGEADRLAGERATAQIDVDGMKVAWDGSRHAVEVADRMARLVASDPQAPPFIFPFNQQHAAAVAAATAANRMGDTKSSGVGSAMPSSATAHASAAHPGAPAMNLSFANLQPADAQFLAILQNGYPFQVAAQAANSSQSYSSGNQHPVLLHGPAHRQDTNTRLQDGQSSLDE